MPVTITGSNTPTAGGVVYGDGTTYVTTSAGTSGQALVSNGAGAPSFGTLGVAAGGTGSTSLTANNVLLGNGTSALQVVAPGTNGNVLTSNGTTWTSATPATGAMVLLATVTANNSATVVITSGLTSTYDQYELRFTSVVTATNSAALYMRTSSNGGSSYDSGAGNYTYASVRQFGVNTPSASGSPSATEIQIVPSGVANTASFGGTSGVIRLYKPGASQYFSCNWLLANYLLADPDIEMRVGAGNRMASGVVNALQFFASSGNITSGTFRLYGIANS